jgi:HEAT repeat protein
MLYYLSKESQTGQLVTEELINALTYSSSDVKWLIIQTLGRLKDKRALHALEFAVSDTDFLVKYWAIVSLKSIQES